jgi:hypothetical protein
MAIGAVSCGPSDADSPAPAARPVVQPVTQTAEDLRSRAGELWEARQREDWATCYQFEDPRLAEATTVDQFIAWCEQEEPFRTLEHELLGTLSEGDLGWVEVRCRTAMRRFPDVPAREVTRWEKWRRVDGRWYPVPRGELDAYPESPAVRDADEESRLGQRVELASAGREAADWDAVYELIDPQDLTDVDRGAFGAAADRVVYLSHDVQWIQVIADRGDVRVVYQQRLNDPSLTKLPPDSIVVTERWVRRDGRWYLDLKPSEG